MDARNDNAVTYPYYIHVREFCHGGIIYLFVNRYLDDGGPTVAYNIDGTIKACK